MNTKEVNQELESEAPVWCSEHGRWECQDVAHDPKCQHGNLLDDGCDKCEATEEWFDGLAKENVHNAGGECPSRVHGSSSASLLQLDYPVWRLSFSAYAEKMGWKLP